MGQVTNGIDKIEIADIGDTNWRTLGYTNIDSATVTNDGGNTNDFTVEEIDIPLFSRFTPGKDTLAFQIADPNLAAYTEVFGGTITGVGDAAVWNAPLAYVQKEFKVRITPKIGYVMTFNRMLFRPVRNWNLGKNNLKMIDVSADVLVPIDGITPAIQLGGVVSGSGGSQTAQTITFAPLGSKSISGDSPIMLAATASSGLPVTYMSDDQTKATISGNVLTLLATGTVNIIAIQMGNPTYAPATPEVNALTITS